MLPEKIKRFFLPKQYIQALPSDRLSWHLLLVAPLCAVLIILVAWLWVGNLFLQDVVNLFRLTFKDTRVDARIISLIIRDSIIIFGLALVVIPFILSAIIHYVLRLFKREISIKKILNIFWYAMALAEGILKTFIAGVFILLFSWTSSAEAMSSHLEYIAGITANLAFFGLLIYGIKISSRPMPTVTTTKPE